jgi:hypothetical protein
VQNSAFANLLSVLDDGKVGIGTNTPSRTLTVTGDGARIKDLNIGVSSATAISNTSNIIANFSSNGIGVKSGGVLNASAIFHIQGSGTTSATTALLVQNSAGTEAFKVNDAGDLFFNGLETSSMRIKEVFFIRLEMQTKASA